MTEPKPPTVPVYLVRDVSTGALAACLWELARTSPDCKNPNDENAIIDVIVAAATAIDRRNGIKMNHDRLDIEEENGCYLVRDADDDDCRILTAFQTLDGATDWAFGSLADGGGIRLPNGDRLTKPRPKPKCMACYKNDAILKKGHVQVCARCIADLAKGMGQP